MAAIARLDCIVCEVIAAHDGVRPVEQGEGDSFVVAFGRASDAVACALALQRAPLAPIRLRIGVHTGEVQLRDEGNYIGPTVNRTARLRIWPTAARPCSRAPPEIWWSTGSRPTPGRPIWAHTRYGIYRVRNGWCSYAIPIFATSFRRCGRAKPLSPRLFRCSSRVSWAAKPK